MKAYYINLARRTDRRASLERQLDRLGIKAERIEAVTPTDLSPAQRARHCDTGKLHWVTEPELSCSLSHHIALRTFLASEAEHALVLEDDVVLAPGLPALLASPMPSCDVLRLETFASPQYLRSKPFARIAQGELFAMHGWCWGTAAYVISRRGAEILLADTEALSAPYDRVIFNRYRAPGARLRSWQLVPALAIQQHRHVDGLADGDIAPAAKASAGSRSVSPLQGLTRWWESEIQMGLPKTMNMALGRAKRRIIPFAGD